MNYFIEVLTMHFVTFIMNIRCLEFKKIVFWHTPLFMSQWWNICKIKQEKKLKYQMILRFFFDRYMFWYIIFMFLHWYCSTVCCFSTIWHFKITLEPCYVRDENRLTLDLAKNYGSLINITRFTSDLISS